MLKLSSEPTESESTTITCASESCAAEHDGADGEACDSVVSGVLYSARGPNSNPPCGVALGVCRVPISECEVVGGGGGVEQNKEKSGTSIKGR